MKRLMLLFLAVLMILPNSAVAEGNQIMKLNSGEYLYDLLTDGETLYAVGEQALYSCKPGDAEMTQWQSDIRFPDTDGENDTAHNFYEFTLFTGNGGLYGLRCQNDDFGSLESLRLFDLAFTDNGTIVAENTRMLDFPADLQDLEWFYVEKAYLSGDKLYILGQIETGCLLCVMDVNDPKRGSVEQLNTWECGMIVMPDGILLTEMDYTNERQTLYRVGDNGALDELCAIPQALQAIAADPVTGDVYGALDGKAVPVDIETGETGEAVAVLPSFPRRGAVLGDGRVYAVDVGANIALMNTEGQVNAGETLKIMSLYADEWIQNAAVDFSVTHPEIAPSLNTDYVSRDQLLDAMLTQSPDIDVYMLDCKSSGAYEAMRERGFMLPLDGSETLSALVERMYPSLRDNFSKDGALVALPVSAYGFCMGIDEKLLNKLGLSMDDVPRDWLGFLSFLEDEIKSRIDDFGENDRLTYDGMTAQYFGYSLRTCVLDDFINATAAVGEMPDYENPDLVAILEKLDGMDFTEYGLPETEEENYGYGWSSEQAYLIQPQISIELGGERISSTPLMLDIGDSLKGVLALNVQVAFVNPFSAHKEAAVEFIELLAERLPDQLQYMFCPDLNEPLPWPNADKELEVIETQIEQVRAKLESADPADRQMLEEELEGWEKEYEHYKDHGKWMIEAEHLATYRAFGDRLALAVPSWFDEDGSGEAWDLLEQYRNGQMPAREFLSAVNRKARMMAMEG